MNEPCPVSAEEDRRFREIVVDLSAAADAGSWLDGRYPCWLWITPADAAFARWLMWLGHGEQHGDAVRWRIAATDGNAVAFLLSVRAGVSTRAQPIPRYSP